MRQLWIFNWTSGGYNSVTASTREEALEAAKHLARHTVLQVDESTLHVGTQQELNQLDEKYASLFY